MRVQVSIPTELWERVQFIAREEHRAPKNQVERFVWEGIQSREKREAPPPKETLEPAGASH